ncbi:hypothetical protein FA95DRAFT_1577460 [Auriscalpium vulgare]|uniref:Uncharacterized protein n=1 Tax=Auriscalpium vulgare TaxID=40419 RepID=A0ACB8R6R4_9AGAM|nr:hypothetical protein FA95DRAFT_1577460 [Auriscalpium vulgare]
MEATSSDDHRRTQHRAIQDRNHPYRRRVEVDTDVSGVSLPGIPTLTRIFSQKVLIHREVFPLVLARDRLRNLDALRSKVKTEATSISTSNESGPAPALGVALATQPEFEACPHTICEEPQTLVSLHRQVDVVAEKSRRVSVLQEEMSAIGATFPELPDVFGEPTSDRVRLYQETQADIVSTPRPVPAALPRLKIPERSAALPLVSNTSRNSQRTFVSSISPVFRLPPCTPTPTTTACFPETPRPTFTDSLQSPLLSLDSSSRRFSTPPLPSSTPPSPLTPLRPSTPTSSTSSSGVAATAIEPARQGNSDVHDDPQSLPERRELKIRGEPVTSRWYASTGTTMMALPPDYPDVELGDVFVHTIDSTEAIQLWLWDKQGRWAEIQRGCKHPSLAGRCLWLGSDGTPRWVTRKTMSTYASRKKKLQGVCV